MSVGIKVLVKLFLIIAVAAGKFDIEIDILLTNKPIFKVYASVYACLLMF